jgi:hypothetical protein
MEKLIVAHQEASHLINNSSSYYDDIENSK